MDAQIYTSSTSLSSSSSSSSRRGSLETAFYGDLSHEKKKKSRRSVKRSLSFGLGSVQEEIDDFEDIEQTRFPQLIIPNDNYEFRTPRQKKQIIFKRRQSLSPHGTRGLPKVEEVRGDDDENTNRCVFKLGLVLDKNEFNSKYKKPLTLNTNIDQSIPEDLQENVKDPIQYQSPTYKLKVDEVDYQDKKQWNPIEQIEVIEEEKPEYDANAKEKQMFENIKKILVEERDFLKKIVRGELIKEEDILKKQQFQSMFGELKWNMLIEEAEENTRNNDEQFQIFIQTILYKRKIYFLFFIFLLILLNQN
ncbi:hypothetical protein pb186bvf_015225 [Paramecium bursaria]